MAKETSSKRESAKDGNGHWIMFSAVILAAVIAGLFAVYTTNKNNDQKREGTFPYCVTVEEWNDGSGEPIAGATVLVEIDSYRSTSTSDNKGCANFDIPFALQGKRGTVTIATPKKNKRVVQDIRGSATTIVFYPND